MKAPFGDLFAALGKRLRRSRGRKADTFTPIDAAQRTVFLPGTRFDYQAAVRGGLDSNVVMAPVQWIMRTFPEAEPIVETWRARRWDLAEDHPLELLLARPNDFYDGATLLMATVASYFLDGNAYWLKVRSRLGNVVGLWYLPHWLVQPIWPSDGSKFIDHYRLTMSSLAGFIPGGRGFSQEIPRENIVHLRFGLDPRNPRKGLSPLAPVMREVYTDEEASNFSASILRNMGIPGIVMSPKGPLAIPPEDVKATKEYLHEQWRGDHRGEPMVMGAPTEVKQFGFDPQSLMLGNTRDIAEERVCAAIGIPAAVVGFGAGLQQTKVGATMRELRRLAWLQCITPTQIAMARQISAQLLPDFESESQSFRLRFDSSTVSAFLEEETERAKRIVALVNGGIMRVDEGRAEMRLEDDPTQRVYLRPTTLQVVDEAGDAVPVEVPSEDEDDAAAMAAKLLAARGILTQGNGDRGAQ